MLKQIFVLNPGLNAALHDGEIDGGDVTQGEGGIGRQPLPLLLPQRHQLVQHVVRLNQGVTNSVPDPCHFGVDPDPDPWIHASD
jgi:hypothetical protein